MQAIYPNHKYFLTRGAFPRRMNRISANVCKLANTLSRLYFLSRSLATIAAELFVNRTSSLKIRSFSDELLTSIKVKAGGSLFCVPIEGKVGYDHFKEKSQGTTNKKVIFNCTLWVNFIGKINAHANLKTIDYVTIAIESKKYLYHWKLRSALYYPPDLSQDWRITTSE